MPKRVVTLKLELLNHRKYRLRTRREIKAYINASIANKKATRSGKRGFMRSIRERQNYWNRPGSYLPIYKMQKQARISIPTEHDDAADDERFALPA